MAKVLPKKLYVRLDDEGYILAYGEPTDAVEDDGPSLVAEYEMVKKPVRLKKVVVGA